MIPPTTPNTPRKFHFEKGSFSTYVVIITLVSTPMAPMGVTIEAGAYPYATTLPTSPPTMPITPIHHQGTARKDLIGEPSADVLMLCACFMEFMPIFTMMSATRDRIIPIQIVDFPPPASPGVHEYTAASPPAMSQRQPEKTEHVSFDNCLPQTLWLYLHAYRERERQREKGESERARTNERERERKREKESCYLHGKRMISRKGLVLSYQVISSPM